MTPASVPDADPNNPPVTAAPVLRRLRWRWQAWRHTHGGKQMPGQRACGCAFRPDGHCYWVACRPHLDEVRANRDPMRPAIDRALDGDHRLCALDPCSDCR